MPCLAQLVLGLVLLLGWPDLHVVPRNLHSATAVNTVVTTLARLDCMHEGTRTATCTMGTNCMLPEAAEGLQATAGTADDLATRNRSIDFDLHDTPVLRRMAFLALSRSRFSVALGDAPVKLKVKSSCLLS